MTIQQKIHVNAHNATFVTLPPVNELVDKLPAQLFKYQVRDKMRKEFNDKTELIMKELCDTANSNLQVVFNR